MTLIRGRSASSGLHSSCRNRPSISAAGLGPARRHLLRSFRRHAADSATKVGPLPVATTSLSLAVSAQRGYSFAGRRGRDRAQLAIKKATKAAGSSTGPFMSQTTLKIRYGCRSQGASSSSKVHASPEPAMASTQGLVSRRSTPEPAARNERVQVPCPGGRTYLASDGRVATRLGGDSRSHPCQPLRRWLGAWTGGQHEHRS